MMAGIALLFGVAVGTIIAMTTRRARAVAEEGTRGPTTCGWCTFAFGVSAFVLLGVGALVTDWTLGYLGSIILSSAALVVGVTALVRHDRQWPTWVGLVVAVLPAFFWVAFLVGNTLGYGA